MANDLPYQGYASNPPTGSNADTSRSANPGNGSADSSAHPRLDKVVSSAHEAVDSAAESMAQAAETLRNKADRLSAMEKEYAEACRASVREHPLSYLAGALLLGVLVGRLSR
ncbi:hypothetical protein [Ideonella sp.]|uniref:hypothetical protein n=1 Tax=Ideonella sp. TaxID=1929293 RepID=UPI0035B3C4B9